MLPVSLRSVRRHWRPSVRLIRQLFSETGIWDRELTDEVRLSVERAWLERVSVPPPAAAAPSDGDPGQKAYVLAMFPYPSGRLHMGHVRVYTISDAVARFQRLQGKQVLHPMGWDGFGLPAENAALERGLPAETWTRDNIQLMRSQLDRLACCFSWDRQLATCDPAYYRWTQWLFLQLHKAGLAYQKQAVVNWDPVDGTVLADEQVDELGRSWRSGAPVQRRLLRQWFLRTTRFAERLSRSLETGGQELRGWRDVVQLQRHWIGPLDGWKLELQVEGPSASPLDAIQLWTDAPERLGHAAFIGLRSDHPLASAAPANAPDSRDVSQFTVLDLRALCPLSPPRHLPLVVCDQLAFPDGADSVLVSPPDTPDGPDSPLLTEIYRQLSVSGSVPPLSSVTRDQAVELTGAYRCSSRLHDWLISRQRYWGTPIPVVHCRGGCGTVPVPEDQLPVQLPALEPPLPGQTGSPLQAVTDWVNTQCPRCGGPVRRETDTMDTFVDSSWYYLRYLDPHNSQAPFDPRLAEEMMPVDVYVGGKEHAVLHLYYARFVHHFLHWLGLVQCEEPFSRLLVQGQVMGQSYRVTQTGRYLTQGQVTRTASGDIITLDSGEPVTVEWEKMSKSKHNGVEPASVLDRYGADSTRLFMLATVAPTSPRNWSEESFPPLLAWQRRLWLTVGEFLSGRTSADPAGSRDPDTLDRLEQEMYEQRNYHVRTASVNFRETHQLSVAIARLQGLTTALRRMPVWYRRVGVQYQRALGDLIIMCSPVMPCLASEMWTAFVSAAERRPNSFRWDCGVLEQRWPEIDLDAPLELTVEVNGQESGVISLPREQLDGLGESEAWRLAQSLPQLSRAAEPQLLHLQLLPGLGATLSVSTPDVSSAPDDTELRQEVLRKRQERKLLKKEKKAKRLKLKEQREGSGA